MRPQGYFGIGIWHPKFDCNCGTLWRSAHIFGASFCFAVGARTRHWKQASDTTQAWKHVPFYELDDLGALFRLLPYSCPLVGVELDPRARSLSSFVHPERACYLLGAEDHGLSTAVREQCHFLVQIEGLKTCLNVATAGSIVLYDRQTKAKGMNA